MKIIDINNKERDVKYLSVVSHEEVLYVEAMIIPRREDSQPWKEWYPFDEFKERNPVLIKMLERNQKLEDGE